MKPVYRGLTGGVLVAALLSLGAGCAQSTGVQSSDNTTGTITISGAFALYPMMVRWGEEFQKIHPGIQFDISAGGAGKGMTDVLFGAVDIGMVSRAIKPEEEAQGAFWIPVVKDAVFPMVNAQNPALKELLAQGMTQAIFVKIFITGEIKTWGQVVGRSDPTDQIHVYTRSDASGAADVWATYLGKKQEDLQGIGVMGDPGILDAVAKDPLGIGYNNLGYAFDNATGTSVPGTVVLPIDKNNNGKADTDETIETKQQAVSAVAAGKYPSPPARPLNLVTKGKPTSLTQVFIAWVLSDGQKFVDGAGFVPLAASEINSAQAKIK